MNLNRYGIFVRSLRDKDWRAEGAYSWSEEYMKRIVAEMQKGFGDDGVLVINLNEGDEFGFIVETR